MDRKHERVSERKRCCLCGGKQQPFDDGSPISCDGESLHACDASCDQLFDGLCLFSWFPLTRSFGLLSSIDKKSGLYNLLAVLHPHKRKTGLLSSQT